MSLPGITTQERPPFMNGGGEMGRLTRSFDWSSSILGPPESWAQTLKITLNILLNSKFPMFLFWGTELLCFYNDGYRPSLGNDGKHSAILGMPAEKAWPEIWSTIKPLIDQVLTDGEATWSEDQLIPIFRNGRIEDVYWTFSFSRVSNENGEAMGVFVTCSETTEKVLTVERLNAEKAMSIETNEALQRSEQQLQQMLIQMPAKVIFFSGPDLLVETANDAVLQLWEKGREETIGKPLLAVLPELENQPFPKQLRHVFETGDTITQKEVRAVLKTSTGGTKEIYNDYFYQPLTDRKGKRVGVLATSFDVTNKVTARKLQEETEATLRQMFNVIRESEAKFKNVVYQAPVAIAIFNGPDFIIDVYNERVLEYWGRTAEQVAGKPLFEALPEASGQGFEELLTTVLTTGERFVANELPVNLERGGLLETTWINFIYDPVRDLDGKIIGIIVVCNEVTDQVNARKELENAKETLRLSIQAAELGTFDMDLEKGTLDWDSRCRTLFGISHQNEVSYAYDFVNGLHPSDRERIRDIIENQVMVKTISNGNYDVEYRTVGFEDQQLRWIRAKGKVYFDKNDVPKRFIGAVLDITEQKEDEQRKNDFIGMVSHELKTPLTSLTAIIQVLNAKLKTQEDQFIAAAASKAGIQVRRMTNMINGFLNISRLESGKILIEKKTFDLIELIKESIAETTVTSPSHVFPMQSPNTLNIQADPEKINSVLTNLLSNAVKYSPKGKNIYISCAVIGSEAIVSIKDEGIGIQSGDLKKLFDRYYRVKNQQTTHIAGFGIGLYLSAEIIHRHHGRIWVESENDKGSTFYFSLPMN